MPCLNASRAFLEKSATEECGWKIASSFKMPKDLIRKGYDGIHDANFSVDGKFVIVAVWRRGKKGQARLFVLKKLDTQVK